MEMPDLDMQVSYGRNTDITEARCGGQMHRYHCQPLWMRAALTETLFVCRQFFSCVQKDHYFKRCSGVRRLTVEGEAQLMTEGVVTDRNLMLISAQMGVKSSRLAYLC